MSLRPSSAVFSSTGACPATARRRRPCQTTAFCRHSNTRSVGRAAVLETGPVPPQDHKSGTASLPPNLRLCMVSYAQLRRLLKTGHSWGHGAEWTVLTVPNRNILTYLLKFDMCPVPRSLRVGKFFKVIQITRLFFMHTCVYFYEMFFFLNESWMSVTKHGL